MGKDRFGQISKGSLAAIDFKELDNSPHRRDARKGVRCANRGNLADGRPAVPTFSCVTGKKETTLSLCG